MWRADDELSPTAYEAVFSPLAQGGRSQVVARRLEAEKGYLAFDPRRYGDLGVSLVIPLLALAMGGVGFPGGAVYVRNDLIRGRVWRSGSRRNKAGAESVYRTGRLCRRRRQRQARRQTGSTRERTVQGVALAHQSAPPTADATPSATHAPYAWLSSGTSSG